mgnify:CR=1 FL=1
MKLSMPRFDSAPVLVVGDVMLDRYWHGPTNRISPEAPVPVVKVDQIEDRPGGAAGEGAADVCCPRQDVSQILDLTVLSWIFNRYGK